MRILEKMNFVGHEFMYAAKHQMKQEWVISLAAVIGLSQGLKYGGSLKRGLIGAAAVIGAMGAANGVHNVLMDWEKIKRL